MSQEQLENLEEMGDHMKEEIFCMCLNYLRNHTMEELDEIVDHVAKTSTFLGTKGATV
jgi:hypothetical protein